jgi:hypothetical protein
MWAIWRRSKQQPKIHRRATSWSRDGG